MTIYRMANGNMGSVEVEKTVDIVACVRGLWAGAAVGEMGTVINNG